MRKIEMTSLQIRRLTYAALYLALAMVLPFVTGQIPEIGSALCPMHIPALLCGFMCGWPWGLAVGFIAPLLRSVLFGMPALFPGAVAMAFELATYGCLTGLLYHLLPKKIPSVYVTLIAAIPTTPKHSTATEPAYVAITSGFTSICPIPLSSRPLTIYFVLSDFSGCFFQMKQV